MSFDWKAFWDAIDTGIDVATTVVGVIDTIWGEDEEAAALAAAGDQAYSLAMTQRDDTLQQNTFNNEMAKATLQFRREELAWRKTEADKGRREAREKTAYNRRQDVFNRGVDMVNAKLNMRDQNRRMWGGRS
jgi:hypothetical protein